MRIFTPRRAYFGRDVSPNNENEIYVINMYRMMRAEKERERARELLNTTDMAQHTRIRKELNFGQSDAKNLPFTSVTSIFVTYIPIRIGCVLLVELKALLIMHKINRKRWIQNEKNDERKSLARSFVRDNTHTHTPSVSTESTEKRHEKCYPPLHALTRMWIKHETNLNPQLWVVYFI